MIGSACHSSGMSNGVQLTSLDMTGLVAEEIRAMLGRRRMSGRELARKLDVSPSWVSYRLTGTQEIGLNDLARIADALGVGIVDLLPREQRGGRPTDGYAVPTVTGTFAHPDHPIVKKAATLPRPITRAAPAPTGEQRVTLR